MRQRGNLTSRSQGSQSLKQLTARLGLDTTEKETIPFPPPSWSSLIVGCGSNTFGQVSGSTQELLCTSLKPTVLPIAGDNGIHVVAVSAGPQLSASILQSEEAVTLPITAGSDETYVNVNVTNVLYLWGTGLAGINYRQPTAIQLTPPVPSSSSSSSSSSSGVTKGGDEGKDRIRSELPLHPLTGSIHRSIRGVTHVACGHTHIGVITTEGHVFTWGEGGDGRLGHGNRTSISVPKLISSLSKLRALSISCGAFHTAIVACDRGLFADGNHRLLVPITATRSSSSRTSSKTSSRPGSIHQPRLDDLIEEEGEDEADEKEELHEEEEDGNGHKRDVTHLERRHSNPPMTSNSAHSSSQYADEIELHCGDLYICGLAKAGQLGLGSQGSREGGGSSRSGTTTSNIVAVPTRVTHFDREEDAQGGIGYKVAKVSCGMHHTLMLCVPVSSWQSGREVSREGSPRPSTSGTAPESNFIETVVFSCGYNEHGRLGLGDEEKREIPTRIVFPAIDGGAASTGVSRSFYSSFNTCNGAKDFFRSGTGPPSFTATDISAGEQHSLVSGNGACFAFGSNEYGQCGIGSPTTTEMAMTPVLIPIPEGVTVKAIAAGGRHSAAITQCGKFLLFGWGEDAQCTQNEKNVHWPRPARIPRFENMPVTRPIEEERGRRDRREEAGEEEGAKVARYVTTTPVAMALGMSHTLLVLKNVDFVPLPPKPLVLQPAVMEPPLLGVDLVDPAIPLTIFEEPQSPSVEKKQDMLLPEMNGVRKSAMLADEDDEGDVRAVRGIRELLAHQQRKDEEKGGGETNQSSAENEDEEENLPPVETSFAFFMTEEDDS